MAQLFRPGVVAYLTVASALVGMLTGCGTGGGGFGSRGTSSNPLLGTWTKSEISVDSITITCPNTLIENGVEVDSCVAGETIQFTSSGTFTETYPKGQYGHLTADYGTYSLSGSTLTLTKTQTATDTQDSGSLVGVTRVTLATPEVIPSAINISSGAATFTITPAIPATGANYTITLSPLGNPATTTFTLNTSS